MLLPVLPSLGALAFPFPQKSSWWPFYRAVVCCAYCLSAECKKGPKLSTLYWISHGQNPTFTLRCLSINVERFLLARGSQELNCNCQDHNISNKQLFGGKGTERSWVLKLLFMKFLTPALNIIWDRRLPLFNHILTSWELQTPLLFWQVISNQY